MLVCPTVTTKMNHRKHFATLVELAMSILLPHKIVTLQHKPSDGVAPIYINADYLNVKTFDSVKYQFTSLLVVSFLCSFLRDVTMSVSHETLIFSYIS